MKTGMKIITKTGILIIGMTTFMSGTAGAAYFDSAPAPHCDLQLTRQLRFGSEGVDVSVLQDFLNRAGFLRAVPNGHFGPATKTAVRAFQANNFIPSTGQVGPMTLNAINERMCDTDLRGDSLIYSSAYSSGHYGVQTGITYVDPIDPYVRVITPQSTVPNVYTNPQTPVTVASNQVSVSTGQVQVPSGSGVVIAAPSSGVASTNIIYSPSIGYTYGITPASGSLNVLSPQSSAAYREGDTVTITWSTNNLNATAFNVLLENISTNQSRTVATVSSNSATFTLTKELLDAVCAGACSAANQSNYRIVVTTPVRDIAGNMTTLRATIHPVTIVRPFSISGTVSISASKIPVASGEVFRLYVTAPSIVSAAIPSSQYTLRMRAFCPSGVSASIAGVPCGQDFTIPHNASYFPTDIPAMISNPTWMSQDVSFTLTAVNAQGQVFATATTTVRVNAAPFNF